MDNQKDQVGTFQFVEKITSLKMVDQKTFAKKALNYFWFPLKDINISDIFYKIQNFNL